MKKRKWPVYLPNIEEWTCRDWAGWLALVIVLGAIEFTVLVVFL